MSRNSFRRGFALLVATATIFTSIPTYSFAEEPVSEVSTEGETQEFELQSEGTNPANITTEAETEKETEKSSKPEKSADKESETETEKSDTPKIGTIKVKITNDGGKLKVTDSKGTQTEVAYVADNSIFTEDYVVGEVIHIELSSLKEGYEVATYKVTLDSGEAKANEVFEAGKTSLSKDVIVVEGTENIEVSFREMTTEETTEEVTEETTEEVTEEISEVTTEETTEEMSEADTEEATESESIDISNGKRFEVQGEGTLEVYLDDANNVNPREVSAVLTGNQSTVLMSDLDEEMVGIAAYSENSIVAIRHLDASGNILDDSYEFNEWGVLDNHDTECSFRMRNGESIVVLFESREEVGEFQKANSLNTLLATTSGSGEASGVFRDSANRPQMSYNSSYSDENSTLTFLTGVLAGHTADRTSCGTDGAAIPLDGTYYYTCTLTTTEKSTYTIYSYSGTLWSRTEMNNYQDINFSGSWTETKDEGYIRVGKKINPGYSDILTKGLATYSNVTRVTFSFYDNEECKGDPEFSYKAPKGNGVDNVDENGVAWGKVHKVPLGTYYVKETASTSTGTVASETIKKVTVKATHKEDAPLSVSYTNNLITGSGKIYKKDEDTGKPLADAKFTVKYYDTWSNTTTPTGNPKATWVLKSDSTGYATFDEEHKVSGSDFYKTAKGVIILPLGMYEISELEAPVGYLKSDKVVYEIVKGSSPQFGSNGIVEFTNQKNEVPVTIKKVSSKPEITNGNAMYSFVGITFTLTNTEDTSLKYTFTVKADGTTETKKVKPGKYDLDEDLGTSKGYTKGRVQTVTVSATTPGTQTFTVADDPYYGAVNALIEKQVNDPVLQGSIRKFTGVEFTVNYYDNETASGTPKNTWVITAKEDANGKWTASLDKTHLVRGTLIYGEGVVPLGSISIQETKSPEGYAINNTVFPIVIKEGNSDSVKISVPYIVVEEDNLYGNVRVKKVDPDGKPLVGAVFEIVNINDWDVSKASGSEWYEPGEIITTITTNEDGIATIENEDDYLQSGTYLLREVEVPEGYVKAEPIEVIVHDDSTQDVEYTVIDKQVELSKSDISTGELIEGAKLVVTDEEGNVVDEWVSKKDEVHNIKGLEVNKSYTLTEEIAPDGYVKATSIDFFVDNDFKVQKVNMEDDFSKTEIKKTDIVTGEPVIGATLTISKEDGTEVDRWVTTEEEHYIERLPIGTYTLREEVPADGYVTAKEVVFSVVDDGSGKAEVLKVEMKDDTTKAEISKVSITDGKPVIGATLIITDSEGNEVDKWVTDDKPHYIEKLPIGTYTLTEVIEHGSEAEKDGYVTAEEVVFEIKDTPEVQKVVMKDDITKVEISKTDIVTGEPVTGATLTITDSEGNEVDTWVTDENTHYIERLPMGTYTLTEVIEHDSEAEKAGYITADSIEFKVEDTGKIQVVKMEDDFTKVEINKTDLTDGEPVIGATLIITDSEGNEVDKWVTDDKPHYIEHLPVGEYTLTEVQVPDGYVTAEEVTFEVLETGEIQKVEMKDDVTKVEVSKQDITTGKELPGATLIIKDSKGKEVERWVSDDKPHYIEKLPIGDYTLTEVSAPNGYEVAEDVKFTVADSPEIVKVVMKDVVKPSTTTKISQTGEDILIYVYAGFALIASLSVLLGVLKKKRKAN